MVFSYLKQDLKHPGYVVNCKNSIFDHNLYVISDLFLCKIGRFCAFLVVGKWSKIKSNSPLLVLSIFFIDLLILVNKSVMDPVAISNEYFLPCVLLPTSRNEVISALCLITTQCGNETLS